MYTGPKAYTVSDIPRCLMMLALSVALGCTADEIALENSAQGHREVEQVQGALVSESEAEKPGIGASIRHDGAGAQSSEVQDVSRTMRWVPPNLQAKLSKETEQSPVAPSIQSQTSGLASIPDEIEVLVTVTLTDVQFDWHQFRHAVDGSQRAQYVANRRAAVYSAQAGTREWLLSKGAKDIESLFVANQIIARVSGKMARELEKLPGVRGVSMSAATYPGRSWSGMESTDSTLLANFHSNLYDGNDYSVSGGAIRIGIIESNGGSNWLSTNHLGWIDYVGGPSRIGAVKNCASAGCPSSNVDATTDTHSTAVASIVAASIEQGQDSAHTSTESRRIRSGHLPDALIYFYSDGGNTAGVRRAIDEAVEDGVDVINMSLSAGTACSRTADSSGINAALAGALNAGIVSVACGGNGTLNPTACNAWYPGTRSETLAVNGLRSDDETDSYTSLMLRGDACLGGMTIRRFDSVTAPTPVIDLVAPGEFTYTLGAGTNNYVTTPSGGCSQATPVVAAAAGALRHQWGDFAWEHTDARALMVNLLLMGDGWDGSIIQSATMSNLTGAGRIRMHWPSLDDLDAPAGWGWRATTISQGETVSWPVDTSGAESSSITQWKWAVMWDEPDLDNVADIDWYIYDTCPSGGGETLVASDTAYGLRSHFVLFAGNISGKCLVMRAYGYKIPAGGRTFYSADYYHSGNTGLH